MRIGDSRDQGRRDQRADTGDGVKPLAEVTLTMPGQDAPVRLLGRLRFQDLIDLYAAADVFVMLCRVRLGGLEQEGFGIVFLEAAASGVVQVAGQSGGAHEAVEDGVSGLVIPADDPQAAAEAIGSLLDSPHQRAIMGRAARERAVERFSYDVLAPQIAAGLETMVP